jgi:tetratricopeptide (TPR) repeat protein
MTDREPIQQESGNPSSADIAPRASRARLGRYGFLVAVGLLAAGAGVLLVAVYLTPPTAPPLPPGDAATDSTAAAPTEAQAPQVAPGPPSATILLASIPVAASVDQLEQEASGVAAELRARFPELPEALHVAAMLSAQLRQTGEAEKLWQRCIELAPKHEAYYVNLAAVAIDRGNSELAAETLRQAMDAGCTSPDVRHHLALALTNLGRCEEAEGIIERALAEAPESAGCWLVLGQTQLKLGKAEQAEASLRKAIDLGSQIPTAYFALGNACARLGKDDEAAKYRKLFAELKEQEPLPTSERYQILSLAKARQTAVTTLCEAATVHSWQGDSLEAERLLLRAIAIDPGNANSCRVLASLYQGDKRLAEERVVRQRLLDLEPSVFLHYLRLAKVCADLGESASAEAVLKLAMSIWPAQADAYATLSQFYLQAGDASRARWFAQEAVRREPSDEGYRFLAATCRLLGDEAAAEAAFAKARELAAGQESTSPVTPNRP